MIISLLFGWIFSHDNHGFHLEKYCFLCILSLAAYAVKWSFGNLASHKLWLAHSLLGTPSCLTIDRLFQFAHYHTL